MITWERMTFWKLSSAPLSKICDNEVLFYVQIFFLALLTCQSAKLITQPNIWCLSFHPSICQSLHLLSGLTKTEATGPRSPYQTFRHFRWVLQSIPKIRSQYPLYCILGVKIEFSHYNQWDRQMPQISNHLRYRLDINNQDIIMTRPFIACHTFDLDLVFQGQHDRRKFSHLKLLIVAQTVIFGFGRFLSWL